MFFLTLNKMHLFFFFKCICFWLRWVLAAVQGLSPDVSGRGYSLFVACRLLTAVSSGFGARAPGRAGPVVAAPVLRTTGSVVLWLTGLVALLHVGSYQIRD